MVEKKIVNKQRRKLLVGNSKGFIAMFLSLCFFGLGSVVQEKKKKEIIVKEKIIQQEAVWG